jgi:hemerythrin-like metal-binding protein
MLVWKPEFETGVALIDADHRHLLMQINALEEALAEGAGEERLAELVSFLNGYARHHFTREEAVMKTRRCPASAENCLAHQMFVKKLDRWTAFLELAGANRSLLREVHREISAWIRHHILNVDCRLRETLAKKAVSSSEPEVASRATAVAAHED